MVTQIDISVPTSPNHPGTVPLFNAWIMWWNAESLSHGLMDYWDAPIFHPESGAFAFSEPQPLTMLLAPCVWWFQSPTVAYNVYLMATLVLNGWFTAWLLRRLGCSTITQFLGGAAMLLHPLAVRHLEAVQLLALWPSLWLIGIVLKLHYQPSWRGGAQLGVACVLLGSACLHHALFLALTLLLCGGLAVPWSRLSALAQPLALAALIVSVTLGPMVWHMHRIHRAHDLVRDPEVVASLSATVASWLSWPAAGSLTQQLLKVGDLPDKGVERPFPGPLLPGWASTLLALATALGWVGVHCYPLNCWRKRRLVSTAGRLSQVSSHNSSSHRVELTQASVHALRPVAYRFLVGMCVVSGLLSFGPNLDWGGWAPWELLCDIFPPFESVRSPYRFAYLTQASIILLACLGSDALITHSRNKTGFPPLPGYGVRLITWLGIASLACLAAENLPERCRMIYPPQDSGKLPEWVDFVARYPHKNDGPPGAVLCLPTAAGVSEVAHELSTRWMLWGTQHRRPLLNGYSGFLPNSWLQLSLELHQQGLTLETLDRIGHMNCQLIVLRKPEAGHATEQLEELSRLPTPPVRRIFADRSVEVWELGTTAAMQ